MAMSKVGDSRMKQKADDILEAFLPAMAKIQDADASDEDKKRMAKEWMRSKLSNLLSDGEKPLE